MHKYAVGDWMYGDAPGEFWQITALIDMGFASGGPGYNVTQMRDEGDDRGFLFIKKSPAIPEKDLKPIFGIFDTFLCLIAELKEERECLLCKADSIDSQIEEVVSVRDLFKERTKEASDG
jgi:hypothetical protein